MLLIPRSREIGVNCDFDLIINIFIYFFYFLIVFFFETHVNLIARE